MGRQENDSVNPGRVERGLDEGRDLDRPDRDLRQDNQNEELRGSPGVEREGLSREREDRSDETLRGSEREDRPEEPLRATDREDREEPLRATDREDREEPLRASDRDDRSEEPLRGSERSDDRMLGSSPERSAMQGSSDERSSEPMRSAGREGSYGNDSGFSRQELNESDRGLRDDRSSEDHESRR